MITVLDVETTFSKEGDPSPFNPDNRLVSVGINDEYYFFHHKDLQDIDTIANRKAVQEILDKSELVIGHNLKFDMSWLYQCGFTYGGNLYDTMIGEYIIKRGEKKSVSLKACCQRRNISSKFDVLETYMNKGYNIDEIPFEQLRDYGIQDVKITKELYDSQMESFDNHANSKLIPTRDLMNEFLKVLIDMESNGNYVDLEELGVVEKELEAEYYRIKNKVDKIVAIVMGDTKINLSSTEDLSKVIYSRKVQDKSFWVELFNIGLNKETHKKKRRPILTEKQFEHYVLKYTDVIYKTIAEQCSSCKGLGYIRKNNSDGTISKRLNICPKCNKEGVIYTETEAKAGFGYITKRVQDVSQGGFKTDRGTLEKISMLSEGLLKEFVDSIIRYSAVSTYLNTFITGIKDNTRGDNILHPSFNQHVTTTGRLSSSKPNFQNMPRGDKFPIKRAITSRFYKGSIVEVDFAQLEFRTAVFLAQDKQGMKDIENGVDVHQYTADIIGCSRQEAKAHTFKPLYGGMMGKEKEVEYYKKFLEKYQGIAEWHRCLLERAFKSKIVKLPSGREYYFPHIRRSWNGTIKEYFYSQSTEIKNYPVQGFATADIVPIACINVWNLLKENNMKTLLINTVHDSVILDVHPDEYNQAIEVLNKGFSSIKESLKDRFDCELNVPLDFEIKSGKNWLDLSTEL
tara:strand:+ start:3966 stop:6014 length:2049 start_codon:yes stop_codon:yes gene_type:complete